MYPQLKELNIPKILGDVKHALLLDTYKKLLVFTQKPLFVNIAIISKLLNRTSFNI